MQCLQMVMAPEIENWSTFAAAGLATKKFCRPTFKRLRRKLRPLPSLRENVAGNRRRRANHETVDRGRV